MKKPGIMALLLVMAAATALLVPFLLFGSASGHDFEFHVSSWMDVVHQWHERVPYPQWAALANWGYGEPRFIFYPPASWLMGPALSLLLPWPAVPGAFFWICMVVGGAGMYRLAREWLPEDAAILAALLYAANPYQQLQLYWRSDFAENMAAAILPLVVLYEWRAARGDGRAALWMAALFGATWLMNAPAAVVVTYSLALLVLATAIEGRSWRGLLLGAGAMALGFALAALYILPAAYERNWVNIGEVLSSGLKPDENFVFTWGVDPEHTYFNWKVSMLAIAELLAAVLALLPARRLREQRAVWWPLLALLGVSAALMFRFTDPAWRFLPELHFVQFPWRWLLTLNVVLVLLVAAVAVRGKPVMVWTASLVLLAVCAVALAHNAWWDPLGVKELYRTILVQGKGYFGTDEYGVRGSDHYDLKASEARVKVLPVNDAVPPAEIRLQRWRTERKVFTVKAEQPVTVVLRLMSYPGWQADINGKPAPAHEYSTTKQLAIDVPAGKSRVVARFTPTVDRTLGKAISAGAAGFWLLLLLRQRRRAAAS